MMNGEETDGGISLGDMEKALVCLLMTSMEAPVQAESAGLTQEMFADASLGFVYEVIMKIYAMGVRPDMVLVERGMREADEELAAKLGGLSFLLPYMLNVRHDGNVAAYVEGIKKQYKLRCLVTLFGTMAFKAGKVSSVPEELVDEAERLLMQFRQKTAEGAPVRTIGELAAEAVSWHYRRFGGELEAEQVKSGLAEFDYVTGGFHNTELTIVAGRPSDGKTAVTLQMARPSMGKTAFVLNITDYIAVRRQKTCLIFSLEMSSLQMLNRVLAGMTDVNPDHLRINKPTGRELGQLEEAALRLKDLPFYLDYTVGATVEQIRAKVLLQCRLGKCDLVVVDYLHLLGGDRRKGETQEQMVGRNVRALKQLALDSNCPVLTVSQMNRACEARADKAYLPVMSDLRDSGTIEQVADCVAFIYRPERYGFTRDEKTGHSLVGVGKIYIAKNRNGSTGIARFRYNPSFTRITDYIQPGTQTSLGL